MGIHAMLFLHPVGRKNSHQILGREAGFLVFIVRRDAIIDHQRAIKETVRMVIHEIALKQERSVLGLGDELIPDLFSIDRIWNDCHFPMNLRNSL